MNLKGYFLMTIRQAGEADIDGMLKVRRSNGISNDPDPAPGYQWAMQYDTVLVAVEGEEVIGFGLLRGSTIDFLYVSKERHGDGMGSRLLDEMERIARKKGENVVHVHASPPDLQDFEKLRSFYVSRGYKETSVLPGRYADLIKEL
jgi:ribosomal protein S18 acetylase RimI-like enzyme